MTLSTTRQRSMDAAVEAVRPVTTGLVMVGTYPPRACGVATFTRDLRWALLQAWPDSIPVVALDRGSTSDPDTYPGEVAFRAGPRLDAHRLRAAVCLDRVGVVSLQHEFGLYPGIAGEGVLDLIDALARPVITTLHTVPTEPDRDQLRVLVGLADRSVRLVVMSERGRSVLTHRYAIDPGRIRVVPHGVPDLPFVPTAPAKAALGLERDTVILSYGLISPNKGLEMAIRSLAGVLPSVPDAILVIAGETHPEVARQHGESYRRSVQELAGQLGVAHRVRFVDHYLSDDELRTWLLAADLFVTPFGDAAQVTSGTLAAAVASGRAVVSTPFEHARELLADGRGRLVPFDDPASLAAALVELSQDHELRARMRCAAWEYGRRMVWPAVAVAYTNLFAETLAAHDGVVA